MSDEGPRTPDHGPPPPTWDAPPPPPPVPPLPPPLVSPPSVDDPPPPPPPAMPPPVPGGTGGKPWWKRTWVIVVGVLVVLTALGAIFGEGEETSGTASDDSASAGDDDEDDDDGPTTTAGPRGAELIPADDVDAGTCFNEPTTSVFAPSGNEITEEGDDDSSTTTEPAPVSVVPAVDCSEPHLFEATGNHELEGEDDAPPGIEEMAAAAEAPCEAFFSEHVGVGSEGSVHHSFPLLFPTEESWADGFRSVLCVAEADDFTEIRGDVEGQGPTALVDTRDLQVGDCFFDRAEGVSEVVRVACQSPHDNEVVGFHDAAGGDVYPGGDTITAEAEGPCDELFAQHVGEDAEDSDLQAAALFFPSEAGWAEGDRRVTCVAFADDLSLVDEPAAG